MTIPVTETQPTSSSLSDLWDRYRIIRRRSERLAEPLPVEDQLMQTMPDVSPTRWHLAHTTWFFETFVAGEFLDDYKVFQDGFDYLFNSYYQGAGPAFERSRRGTIGRPRLERIHQFRRHVDEAVDRLFDRRDSADRWAPIVEVGLQHECQHQELILTDIKHVLASNPLRPAYRSDCAHVQTSDGAGDSIPPMEWMEFGGGVESIGYDGDGFAFDNEMPRHQVMLQDFRIARRPVLCGEFMQFIDDGGYDDPNWWLSEGWSTVQDNGWQAPMYWERRDDQWWTMTLGGMRLVDPAEPVCHVSYFEADAYARWAEARLPTEAEWEVASRYQRIEGNFLGADRLHPHKWSSGGADTDPRFFGDVWEWTASPYTAYPGFEPWDDTLGEYNGKFMCNQYVLKGGSCVSAADHLRRTYRNFFYPDDRWQFTGFRLAD